MCSSKFVLSSDMQERGKNDRIEISDLDSTTSRELYESSLRLVNEFGVQNKPFSGIMMKILGINVREFSGKVNVDDGTEERDVKFIAFTTGSNDVVIDIGQIKSGSRVRLSMPG